METQNRLKPEVFELLSKSDQERIDFILKDKWVGYTVAKNILSEMEDLLSVPKRQRKKFIFIEGKTGNGKTTLLRHFYELHPAYFENGMLVSRVIYIEGPSGPSVDELYANILFALNAPIVSTTVGKKIQLRKILPKVKAEMLLIDNFHDFKYGNSDLRKKYVAAVRKLATDFEINLSIVATGTYIARNVIENDAQIYSRFRFRSLPVWRNNNIFRSLLYNFEKIIPLKKESELFSDKLVNRILTLSEGILANIEEIIQDSALLAIKTGKERIDEEILKTIPFNTKHQPQPVEKSEYPEDYQK